MVTITLQQMSGSTLTLAPMQSSATVRDVATEVRSKLSMPISVQNLLHGATSLKEPHKTLLEVFGNAEEVNLTVVRRPFTADERRDLFKQLVRAVGAGRVAQVRELLREGAQVNLVAEGGGVDTSIALDHWSDESTDIEMPTPGGSAQSSSPVKQAPDGGTDDSEDGDNLDRASVDSEASDLDMDETPKVTNDSPCGGVTPLMMAIAIGHDELQQDLRACGAEEPDMEPSNASLGDAFGHRNFPDIMKLIVKGVDVNTPLYRGQGIRDTERGGPLHACASLYSDPGAFEVAQLLLQKKADTAMGDSEGDTPLAHAKYFGATEIFQLLQGNGAKIAGPFYRRFGRFVLA